MSGYKRTRGWSLAAKLAYYSDREEGGCLVFKGPTTLDGYGQLGWQGRVYGTHRLSYIERYGSIPAGKSVLHRCDNPRCIEPDHLFLGSQEDNVRDMDDKGRRRNRDARGERNNSAKLTYRKVEAIRASRLPPRVLAERYGVSRSLISMILNQKIWRDSS